MAVSSFKSMDDLKFHILQDLNHTAGISHRNKSGRVFDGGPSEGLKPVLFDMEKRGWITHEVRDSSWHYFITPEGIKRCLQGWSGTL